MGKYKKITKSELHRVVRKPIFSYISRVQLIDKYRSKKKKNIEKKMVAM